ncbi:hypothetical protein [Rhodopirellula bahusiensis]|uniref:hypothetical protein n=1 Tax=Rhodopirellula bahusiensis TaxID=2014065 RepID=UPI0032660796
MDDTLSPSYLLWDASLSEADPIRSRALRFADTFDWINPVIVADQSANPDIVARFGNGVVDDYHEFTIEMQWSAKQRDHLLATSNRDDLHDLKMILGAPNTVRVTCNATDIIFHDFPGVDLD